MSYDWIPITETSNCSILLCYVILYIFYINYKCLLSSFSIHEKINLNVLLNRKLVEKKLTIQY